MPAKRPNTYILATLIIIAFAYIINSPLLPLRNETKKLLGYPLDSLLNSTELTGVHGYVTEEHRVTTEDGYILQLFRITHGVHCKGAKKKVPVILMHGLLQSSDAWLDAGPGHGLGYLLADACYDLWLGNQRGNYYSRAHKALDPDKDSKFWQFSVDEIGKYDIPATVDYVLNSTGMEKLNYIGYSQGSGVFFVMCSEKPEYCDKVNVLIALAPAARHTNTKSVGYRALLEAVNIFNIIFSPIGIQEVFSKGDISQEFLAFVCQLQIPYITDHLCDKFEVLLESRHAGSVDDKTTRVLFGHFPAGTSVQNMIKYRQSMSSDTFIKFNYGIDKNLELYGTEEPPEYNLTAVSTPVVVVYGRNDYLVCPKDIEWLVDRLPNVVEAIEVKDPLWNHIDVPYSRYTKQLVFPEVTKYLDKYSHR